MQTKTADQTRTTGPISTIHLPLYSVPAHHAPLLPSLPPQTDTRTIVPTSTAQTLLYSPPEVLQRLTTPGHEAGTVKWTADRDVFAY